MRSRLCMDSRLENTFKCPENGCFLTKTTVFHGPSGETRTRGILVPKTEGNFFLTISAPFSGVSFQYPVLSGTVFSTVSGCSNPVYGQKCGQRPGLSKSQGVLDSRKQNSETEKLTSIPSRKFRNRNFADEMIEFA